MALLTNLPLLMILIVGYWTVSSVGVQVLRRDGLLSTAGAFTIVGWLLMLYPVALAILLRVPFKFTKNTSFIRWNFLSRMYRRDGKWPPRVDNWLAESKARPRPP